MSVLKAFDEALVQVEMGKTSSGRGYRVESTGRTYPAYMDLASWNAFKDSMIEEHRKQFDQGGGKELDEKDGRPPKMASYASSSQMIYKLSKHIRSFIFEKQLTTTVGGKANLDGYLESTQVRTYIEAKCREPYGHQAEQAIKQNYRKVYEYLQLKMPGVFDCTMEDIPEAPDAKRPRNEMLVTFSCRGNEVAAFDIKQMICHLLAVATDRLLHPDQKSVLFLYLLYNPTELHLEDGVKEEIFRIYNETCQTAVAYDFKVMFGHIVDFVGSIKKFAATKEELQHIKNGFDFVLCDQHTYKDYLVE